MSEKQHLLDTTPIPQKSSGWGRFKHAAIVVACLSAICILGADVKPATPVG